MKPHEVMRMQAVEATKAIKVPEKLMNKEKSLAAQQTAAEKSGDVMIAHASKESLAKLSKERAHADAAKVAQMKKEIAKQYGIRV